MLRRQKQRRPSRSRPANDAFTLVELLVVIAIIAILAGLLMTVIGRALEGGHNAACINNLRQMIAATKTYVQDNNERFPRMRWHTQYLQFDYLGPYLEESWKVFRCPSARRNRSGGDRWADEGYFKHTVDGEDHFTDYKFNDANEVVGRDNKPPIKVHAWRDPSTVVVARDLGWVPRPRHGKADNFVFWEGHVKRLTPEEANAPDADGAFPWYRWGGGLD